MTSVAALRRRSDVEHAQRLIQRSRGALLARSALLESSSRWPLRSNLPSSLDAQYPHVRSAAIDFTISLPARYPFEAPKVSIETPIFHPNVFPNGVVCLGTQWQASEGMDLFLSRVLRLLCYDPLLVNVESPANGTAARWYLHALQQYPDSFPTVRRHEQAWLFDPRAEKVVIRCPNCQLSLRLPADKEGTIQCPGCQHQFYTRT